MPSFESIAVTQRTLSKKNRGGSDPTPPPLPGGRGLISEPHCNRSPRPLQRRPEKTGEIGKIGAPLPSPPVFCLGHALAQCRSYCVEPLSMHYTTVMRNTTDTALHQMSWRRSNFSPTRSSPDQVRDVWLCVRTHRQNSATNGLELRKSINTTNVRGGWKSGRPL